MTEKISKPKREHLLDILDEMILQSEKMSQEHKIMSVSNYDMESQMIFNRAMFQAINDDLKELFSLMRDKSKE